MRIILDSTSEIVELNGVPARVWRGKTDAGVPLQAFVTRIAVERSEDNGQFERELAEQNPPTTDEPRTWPLRMIL